MRMFNGVLCVIVYAPIVAVLLVFLWLVLSYLAVACGAVGDIFNTSGEYWSIVESYNTFANVLDWR